MLQPGDPVGLDVDVVLVAMDEVLGVAVDDAGWDVTVVLVEERIVSEVWDVDVDGMVGCEVLPATLQTSCILLSFQSTPWSDQEAQTKALIAFGFAFGHELKGIVKVCMEPVRPSTLNHSPS